METTNKKSFQGPPEAFRAVCIDAKTKADLRKSHWTFGGFGQVFTSTQNASYQKRSASLSVQDSADNQKKISLMRGHHFNFGN